MQKSHLHFGERLTEAIYTGVSAKVESLILPDTASLLPQCLNFEVCLALDSVLSQPKSLYSQTAQRSYKKANPDYL